MNSRFSLFFVFFFILGVMASCDRVTEDPKGDEMARFEAWIDINNLSAYKTPSGLYFITEREGTGPIPVDSNYVLFSYAVRNLDGAVFETNYKDTAELYAFYGIYNPRGHYVPLFKQYIKNSFSIPGVEEAFDALKEGSKIRLIMSSDLAYGGITHGNIPPYSSIIYDIELEKVITDPEAYEQSIIDKYLVDSTGFELKVDSIYYKRTKIGTGTTGIGKDSIVKVNYVGRFLDGYIFDSNIIQVAKDNGFYDSRNPEKWSPLEFSVGLEDPQSPILGFHVAVKQMQEGEKAYIIIPSKYAYGKFGNTSIPPYSPLLFEIEVVSVARKLKLPN